FILASTCTPSAAYSTPPLHDALPICPGERRPDPLPRIRVHYVPQMTGGGEHVLVAVQVHVQEQHVPRPGRGLDACVGRDLLECRSEEPRLNSSHEWISYAVFCLNKKN